jgi:acetaldehyde dehydrogenase (acetylating)
MKKMKVGIIGTGNIGTDLLIKVTRSPFLECGIFTGRNLESKGIGIAKSLGVKVSFDSIHAIEEDPSCCDIVFDATSARVHEYDAPILKKLGKFTIDLTPSRIGRMCIPVLNLEDCLDEENVNLITCGGQGAIPVAYAIAKAQPQTSYIEVVASIASKSAGPGTRNNIDEFTQTTSEALALFTGVAKTKAIIILNPAEPPIIMRNTVYAVIDHPDMDLIYSRVHDIEAKIRKYVPGYRVILGPVHENGRVTTTIEVVGLGDYLPEYSGNLDIITCAAVNIAEEYARRRL